LAKRTIQDRIGANNGQSRGIKGDFSCFDNPFELIFGIAMPEVPSLACL
jgi:hypothetical protein